MAHTHSVAAHSHDIDHGIYEFSYLPPSVVVKVDGNVVAGLTALTADEFEVAAYLEKDSNGKILRSQFHTIEIIPNTNVNNPKGLGRIYANVIKQVYMQSIGGGDY
jgi:hypothetical protein